MIFRFAFFFFFFQAEDGIRDLVRSRGLGDVYKRQAATPAGGEPGTGEGQSLIMTSLSDSDGSKDRDDTRSARSLRSGLPGAVFYVAKRSEKPHDAAARSLPWS